MEEVFSLEKLAIYLAISSAISGLVYFAFKKDLKLVITLLGLFHLTGIMAFNYFDSFFKYKDTWFTQMQKDLLKYKDMPDNIEDDWTYIEAITNTFKDGGFTQKDYENLVEDRKKNIEDFLKKTPTN